jgi:hypothetical protein
MTAAIDALDHRALDRLADELGDRAFVADFAGRYRALLHGRVERMTRAVSRRDVESAMDATLSLKVASLAVGAIGLAALALEVESHLRVPDLATAALTLDLLTRAAVIAGHALDAYLAG